MNKNKRIYIFFIIVSLIFWNPLSFYFIYKGTDIVNIKIISYLFWITPIIGFTVIILINKYKLNNFLKNISLSFFSTGIIFSFLVLVNFIIGLLIPIDNKKFALQKGLMFNPNTKAIYKTVEFDFTSEINNIGLRDKDMAIDKGDKFRIVCFGDSWTYGWGVNIEHSWPKKLEALLSERGFEEIEVINCGQGGAFTTRYKSKLEDVLTLLNPDLVLIGVLQADDLIQSYQRTIFEKSESINHIRILDYVKDSFYNFLLVSFDNLLHLFRTDPHNVLDIDENWKLTALEEISNFNDFQRLRFFTLDDSIKYLFQTGNLNPSLLWICINFPEGNLVINDPKNPATVLAINEMRKDFLEMKTICERNSVDLIFINLPEASFTGHKVIKSPQQNIFDKYFYDNNNIDSIYRSIADYLKIPYFELTDEFKQLESKTSYFFKYDGHPNEKGYEEISKGICDFLINEYDLKSKINLE